MSIKDWIIPFLVILSGCNYSVKEPQFPERLPRKYALIMNFDEPRFAEQSKKAKQELQKAGYDVETTGASRSGLSDKLERFGDCVGINDVFICAYFGHGTKDHGQHYISIPNTAIGTLHIPTGLGGNFAVSMNDENMMDDSELKRKVDEKICARKVYLIEACYSGHVKMGNDAVLSSSDAWSYSGNEGFGTYFCKGVNEGDMNNDNIVTIGEAFDYASSKINKNIQNPRLKGCGRIKLK